MSVAEPPDSVRVPDGPAAFASSTGDDGIIPPAAPAVFINGSLGYQSKGAEHSTLESWSNPPPPRHRDGSSTEFLLDVGEMKAVTEITSALLIR